MLDFEDYDFDTMTLEEVEAAMDALRLKRDSLEDREPRHSDRDAFNAWVEACDRLEDLIDDACDRLDELKG